MASPCLSGGGGGRVFDLEIAVKSAATTTTTSSPSSTLSESGNCSPLAISTRRKPRSTPRKRPNQTYNEAAALLSTAYPKLFPAKHLLPSSPASAAAFHSFNFDSADSLLLPASADSRFLPAWEKVKQAKSSSAAASEVSSRDNSNSNSKEFCHGGGGIGSGGGGGYEEEGDDFDAESILDEEIEEGGIDSIMGNLSVVSSSNRSEESESVNVGQTTATPTTRSSFVYGYPPGFIGNGNGNGIRAFRRVDDWWSYPVVDVFQISPRLDSNYRPITTDEAKSKSNSKKKTKSKKKKKIEDLDDGARVDLKGKGGKLLLKLNYDDILKAWSGKESPLPADSSAGKR
ncbi:Protein CHLOROPLAST IMPORT APPARATUS 2 [Linum grandiflorum]